MRPLHALAGGLLLIALDFRTTSVDLLPDVVGWLLVLWTAWCWHRRSLIALAAIGAVCSLPLFALPYHYVQYDPIADETVVVSPETDMGYAEHLEYDSLTGWTLGAYGVSALVAAGVVLLALRTMSRRASHWDGPSVRQSLRRLRLLTGLFVATWTIPRIVAAATKVGDGLEPVWDDPAARVALIGALAAIALAITLAVEAREPWTRSLRQRPLTLSDDDQSVIDQ